MTDRQPTPDFDSPNGTGRPDEGLSNHNILEWLPSDQNLSDIFTKPLSKLPFRRLRDLILFMNDRDRPLQVASLALRLSRQLEQPA